MCVVHSLNSVLVLQGFEGYGLAHVDGRGFGDLGHEQVSLLGLNLDGTEPARLKTTECPVEVGFL